MERIDNLIDSLKKSYDENFATTLGNISNEHLTKYIIIIVIFLFFATIFSISLTFIFFFIIAIIIIYVFYSKNQIDQISDAENTKIKSELIIPQPTRLDNHPELIDFLFSIREFYYINPNAFYGVVSNLDHFMQLYEEIMNDVMLYCTQNLEVAVQFSREAQNNLQSMIFNLDVDKKITRKFHQSLRQFHLIMRQYVHRLIEKCNSNFNPDNIDNHTKPYIEYGPREYNYYNNTTTFDFY